MSVSEFREFNVVPRPKKSVLPPPPKKRRREDASVEEVNFDFGQREEYLTGFHKRKVERAKQAKMEAAKREREERIQQRKEVCDAADGVECIVCQRLTVAAARGAQEGGGGTCGGGECAAGECRL